MKELIIKTIEGMLNASFLYGKSQQYIRSYSMNDDTEKFTLITDKRSFTRPYESTMEFLNQFEPVPEGKIATIPPQLPFNIPQITLGTSVINDAKDILLDSIRKVQEDPNYIPQAEAIKCNVDGIIALAKTELEYLNILGRLNR